MKKITIAGWVSKSEFNKKNIWEKDSDPMLRIFKTKGREDDYNLIDWPPYKVKVTIEDVGSDSKNRIG